MESKPKSDVRDTRPFRDDNDSGNHWWKYAIGFLICGAAIGNVFTARRAYEFLKTRKPSAKYNSQSHGKHHDSHSEGPNFKETSQKQKKSSAQQGSSHNWQEELRKRQRYKNFEYQQEEVRRAKESFENWQRKRHQANYSQLSSAMRVALKKLDMPSELYPSEKQVKEAFRKIALKSHPDRFALDDPQRKVHDMIFRDAVDAYKHLMSEIESK